ncbi:diguanylate cyclase/phosphodiesterase (GGDEF & EAL domains) with PAS/PAC sensor(s) [plant metagenome]|uniref:Diguanylate cyclase/phosphodiesterase (GGDEF & EAL domains) with PAS/PAC sensor(S) n=1 Tax=plant metagenome TaxID=1297885 RepID=A0A484PJL0_9ZZZZ
MTGTYDLRIVLISLLIAGLASYTALSLTSRLALLADRRQRLLWLTGGAIALGTGIWCMHFVGMLAFSLPIEIGYDLLMTAASLLIAIAASGIALHVASNSVLGMRRLVASGVVMGAGIATMHYLGMDAMRMFPPIRFNPWLFLLSAFIAVAASIAAMWIAHALRAAGTHGLQRKRLAASIIMALAVTGMHYTGMAAASFAPDTVCLAANGLDNAGLGMAAAAITLTLLTITLVLSMLDQRYDSSTRELKGSLLRISSALRRLETVDPLTELPNRSTLLNHVALCLARARPRGRQLAVLFMDLDGFKTINDSLGHSVGDGMLKAFAQRLRQCVRPNDMVARLGGDEFVIVLENLDGAEFPGQMATQILEAMRQDLLIDGTALRVTPSIGIAMFPGDADTVDGLIKNADIAMYSAKQNGRNTYRHYEPAMGEQAMRLLLLQQGLQEALTHDTLTLHFQPKFDGATQRLTGAEALIRWNHPTLGIVPPSEFIPISERSGQIIEIGYWVVRHVCRQLREWERQGMPDLVIAVNLSPKQLAHPDIVEGMHAITREAGISPRRIIFEITESVAMDNARKTGEVIRAFHRVGFEVAIDDFGTGYSSLAYLQQFRVQQLKIDRFFTNGLDTHGEEGEAIVSAIVALAHSLKMQVVAEGVETESQMRKLRDLSCDQVQGYLLARPLPSDEFERFVRAQQQQPDAPGLS